MKDNCFASWYITERCNFDCSYCGIVNPHKIKKVLRATKKIIKHRPLASRYDLNKELDNVIRRFLGTGKQITFGFTGGEPLVYPHFIDICRRISAFDDFKIALDTNLTMKNVQRFIDAVSPEKVEYIFAALHILERERIYGDIDKFLDDVVLLQNAGYNICVNYVMYPPLFDRIDRDYNYCLDRGVRLILKDFKGVYKNRTYPWSYSEEEKKILSKYYPNHDDEEFCPRNFFGRNCNAGKNLVRIKSNGDITRCVGDHTLLGNIFTGFELYETAQPCVLKSCPCFAPDRLFDDSAAVVNVPVRMVLASKLRQIRNKLKGWWEQE